MINYTLNDPTQQMLLPHLKITEELLSRVATKLSGKKMYAEITAMPDLGIAHNCTRMMGGFFTGTRYVWNSTVPFVPVDATVNVCGTAIFKLNNEISIQEFLKRVEAVLENRSQYTWNYTSGNHFISLCRSNGEYNTELGYYMVVHASANEFKNGPNGLYPNSDVWYYDAIQTEYLEGTSRYLRYIVGKSAERFYEIAKMLIPFNEERNRYFVRNVLQKYLDKEVLSVQHSGIFCGRTDCDITENGRIITAKLANIEPFLSGFTAMYVSPLKRTAQTLSSIYPNCDYIIDERLIEIPLGLWEGLKKTSVNQSDRKAFLKGLYTPPNAEKTHEDVVNRIMSLFKEFNNTYNDSDIILLVTHNGVIRTVKQLLKLEELKTKNSGFIIIDSNDLVKL